MQNLMLKLSILMFCCSTHIAYAAPAQPDTIQKYMTLYHAKDVLAQQLKIKDAQIAQRAQERVQMHLKMDLNLPVSFTAKQQLVIAQIEQHIKQSDPNYRTLEQEYQYAAQRIAKYYSEESLQYMIAHAQTESEQQLIHKSNLVIIDYTYRIPKTPERYLSSTDFIRRTFGNILKIIPTKDTSIQAESP